jgi:hypothetical protein
MKADGATCPYDSDEEEWVNDTWHTNSPSSYFSLEMEALAYKTLAQSYTLAREPLVETSKYSKPARGYMS